RRRHFVNVKGTKAEAHQRLREILASLDKGLPIDSCKVLVRAFLQRWLHDYAVPNTRPRTAERYESDIRLHISPALGHIPLSRLAPADIQAMEARLLARGQSARSVQHVHTVLKEALKHAMRWGLVYRNPAEGVDPPRPQRHEIQPPDADGVVQILRVAKETPYHAVFHFMAFTGCRRGEALGVRWRDVDLENGSAAIVQTLQRLKGRGLVFQPPKSSKSRRSIALDAQTIGLLRDHRGIQLLRQMEMGNGYDDQGLVFPNVLGGPLDPSVLTRNFERLARKANLQGLRLHDLRHGHAAGLIRANIHVRVVQERLGHASAAFTMQVYGHVAAGLQEEAAKSFAALMEEPTR
ncbi:MAG: site-specific integrase, partial [Chloroflexi bacterium]|nr:site-specific integrase [Chloroflexota bacterium]